MRAVDEFFGPIPGTEMGFRAGLREDEGVFLLRGEEVVAVIDGFVADADLGYAAEGLGPVENGHIRPFDEIGADVAHGGDGWVLRIGLVIVEGLAGNVEEAPADDDHVHMGLAASLAGPGEGTVPEVD